MNTQPECWAIIPAAGTGQRMASSIPKQYLKLWNKTIIEHAATALLNSEDIRQIVFALHIDDEYFSRLSLFKNNPRIRRVTGGATRAHSVLNALEAIKSEIRHDSYVLVHDAARPCLTSTDLENLMQTCFQHNVGGVLAAPVRDTIKQVHQDEILSTLDRTQIWCAFTPQMFKFDILYNAITQALKNNILVTDEASAIEYMEYHPCVVEGSISNIKVTRPEDVGIAEMFLAMEKA